MRSNFLWVSAGMAGLAAYRWLLVVMLARQGTPEMLGQYALAVSIATPLVIFSRMRLRSLQASQAEATYQFGHYAAVTLVNSLMVLAIALSVSLAGPYDWVTSGAILLVTAGLVVESGSELCYGYFQQQERMEHIGRSMLLRAALSGLVAGWGLACGMGLIVILSGLGCVAGLMWAAYDVRLLKRLSRETSAAETGPAPSDRIGPVWDRGVLWRLNVRALPLAVGSAVAAFNLSIPRYVLESTAGLEQLGIFSAIAALIVPGNVVMLGMTQAALPRLSRGISLRQMHECRRLALQLVLLGGFVGGALFILFATAGEWLVRVLFTSVYAGHPVVLCILAGAAAVTYVGYALVVVVVAAQRFRTVALVHSVSFCVVLVGSLSFIRHYGVVGAAAVQLTNAICTTTMLFIVIVAILSGPRRPAP